MTASEVYELLEEAAEMPFGRDRTDLVEAAVARAESDAEPMVLMAARSELVAAYSFGGEPLRAFDAFARCLEDFDRDPTRFEDWVDARLRWQYKWLPTLLLEHPEVPLARAEEALDGMEERYRAGGHSLQAVYQRRCEVARHLGDTDAAGRWYAEWIAAARDENSDCEGCEPTARIALLDWLGRRDEAIALAAPVLAGDLDCNEQPEGILTALVFPYLHSGRPEQAVDAHRRGYRGVRSQAARLDEIAEHVTFCALTGNEARALEIVERHLGLIETVATPHATMVFTAAAALLCRRLVDLGASDLIVHRPLAPEGARPEVSAADLGNEMFSRTLELARAFDRRNATTEQSTRVRAVLDAEPIVDFLPLMPHSRPGIPGYGGTPAFAPAVSEPKPIELDPEAEAAVHDFSPARLLEEAEELWRRRRVEDAAPHLRRFDELAAGVDVPPAFEARRADLRGAELVTAGDLPGGAALWDRAARLYGEVGDEERRQQALGRLGTLKCQLGALESGLALVEESTEYLLDSPSVAVRAAASIRLARSYLVAGRGFEALDVAQQAAELARQSGYAVDLADAAFFQAQILAIDESRLGEALELAAQAREGYRRHDDEALVWADLLYGGLLGQTGAPPETVEEVWSEAFSAARGSAVAETQIRAARGRWLLGIERVGEAVTELAEGVAQLTAQGMTELASTTGVDLARAYLLAGRALDAAETAESCLPRLEALGPAAATLVGGCRFVLANAMSALGEGEEAAAEFGRLAALHGSYGDVEGAAGWYEAAGELLTADDLDEDAAEAFGAAARCFAEVGDALGEVRSLRRQALSLGWTDEADRALGVLGEARARLERFQPPTAPDERRPAVAWEYAALAYAESRMLAAADLAAPALERGQQAFEGFRILAEAGIDGAVDAAEEVRVWCEVLIEEDALADTDEPARPGEPHGHGG